MDRTKEYNKITQTVNIPQRPIKKTSSPLIDLFRTDKIIKSKISDLVKCKYEIYNIRTKINEVQTLCQEVLVNLKNFSFEYSNGQEEEVFENTCNLLRGRINEYKLEIIIHLRKLEKDEKVKKKQRSNFVLTEEPTVTKTQPQLCQQQEILIEENSVRLRNQEINQQISEIGNLMEEIGIHVSLQEENFKRIDDLMGQSDKFLENSVFLLKRGLEGMTSTRKTILKFFMFWLILAFLFWILRK